MIVFLPHCSFLSEVSRSIEIARALEARNVPVAFAARGGPYSRLIGDAGFKLNTLEPAADEHGSARFLKALLAMGPRTSIDFYADDELRAAVEAEGDFLRDVGARLVVTGFTLSAYLSTRVAGVPLATDHGGSFVPPVLAHGLCPVPVNPADPRLARLPSSVQRWMMNTVPGLVRSAVAQLNRHAKELGVEPLPSLMSLMCGDLTLVTELPEVLGLSPAQAESWRPSWPFRMRGPTTFRFTGPLYARLDMPLPSDVDALLSSGEPVVYLAPTSVDERFLRSLVKAAKQVGTWLLVGATAHDVGDLADDRTLVSGVLPNHLVMPRVAAAVIMGGQGSVQTAMASGTPFVGLPYHLEQELNISIAERFGMAIRMAPRDATTPALATAIRSLLDDPSVAEGANEAARHYEGVDGASRAADTILAWLRSRVEAGQAPETRFGP